MPQLNPNRLTIVLESQRRWKYKRELGVDLRLNLIQTELGVFYEMRMNTRSTVPSIITTNHWKMDAEVESFVTIP